MKFKLLIVSILLISAVLLASCSSSDPMTEDFFMEGDLYVWDGSNFVLVNDKLGGTLPAGTQGDILYYNGAAWVVLTAGTDGYYLETNGAGANPSWSAINALPAGTQGDILYYNGAAWVVLNAGTDGYYLETNGAGSNPAWANARDGVTLNSDTDVSGNSWVLDEDDMASDDDTKLATQQSIKAYIDSLADGSGPTIVSGSYTGNGGNGRQITIGFKCSHVIIMGGPGGIVADWSLIPSYTVYHEGYQTATGIQAMTYNDTSNTYLHASDGFVVSNNKAGAIVGSNYSSGVYYYWAISE
jgi:hypothetical protein